MSLRQDPDLKGMSAAELRREVMKLRRAIRKHRDAKDNARCWHNDANLCLVLPEGGTPGRMDKPVTVLLQNCLHYINRQQCPPNRCVHGKIILGLQLELGNEL